MLIIDSLLEIKFFLLERSGTVFSLERTRRTSLFFATTGGRIRGRLSAKRFWQEKIALGSLWSDRQQLD